jgi:hypothetical protein
LAAPLTETALLAALLPLSLGAALLGIALGSGGVSTGRAPLSRVGRRGRWLR